MDDFFDFLADAFRDVVFDLSAYMSHSVAVLVTVLLILFTLFVIYVVKIHIAYRMAVRRYREPLGWVLLSLFFSPMLTWIILLIVGENATHREQLERDAQDERRW